MTLTAVLSISTLKLQGAAVSAGLIEQIYQVCGSLLRSKRLKDQCQSQLLF
jgi:hypothetical protein